MGTHQMTCDFNNKNLNRHETLEGHWLICFLIPPNNGPALSGYPWTTYCSRCLLRRNRSGPQPASCRTILVNSFPFLSFFPPPSPRHCQIWDLFICTLSLMPTTKLFMSVYAATQSVKQRTILFATDFTQKSRRWLRVCLCVCKWKRKNVQWTSSGDFQVIVLILIY